MIYEKVKKNKIFILFVFILSLTLNFLFFNFVLKKGKDYWRGDTVWYNNVAIQIAQGNGIVSNDGIPTYYRVPGYAIFLSVF